MITGKGERLSKQDKYMSSSFPLYLYLGYIYGAAVGPEAVASLITASLVPATKETTASVSVPEKVAD